MSFTSKIKIGLGQILTKVGVDELTMNSNIDAMREFISLGYKEKCDVVLFPELAITGYSPEDLLLREDVQHRFTEFTDAFRDEILNSSENPTVIFGAPRLAKRSEDNSFDQDLESGSTIPLSDTALVNAAVVVEPRNHKYFENYKSQLPNWSVFDEARWFAKATEVGEDFEINGIACGVVICRDIWIESSVRALAEKNVKLIFVPNASPFANARSKERLMITQHYAKKYGVAICYVNMVEGCDEVVFDGGSFVVDQSGDLIAQTNRFQPEFLTVELEIDPQSEGMGTDDDSLHDFSGVIGDFDFDPEETYKAIVLGTREFINSISENVNVVIGLSGGVDSALVATLAVDALGANRVHGVLLPSKFTSGRSNDDAVELSKRLGITCETISISNLHELAIKEFDLNSKAEIVSENIQSRLRGLTLMMISNAQGHLVLATSNKSESAVGYCTLYGDTVGAYSPIKDVYKTQVYELCSWRNSQNGFTVNHPLPESILTREPSAELRENQTDEESLYPYEILDAVLMRFVDWEKSIDEIVKDGYEKDAVERIVNLVKTSEFKRKQTPIGPRLTRRNFGKGRRIPISARW